MITARQALRCACTSLAVLLLAAVAPADAQEGPPRVVGKQVDEAVEALDDWDAQRVRADDVGGSSIREVPAPLPEGVSREVAHVVEQQEIVDGDLIVVLTLGAVVPELVGRSQEEAAAALGRNGLAMVPAPVEAPGDAVVAEQKPPEGTLVAFGEAVAVTLETLVTVPSIIDLELAAARQAVEQVGLILAATVEGEGEPDRVVFQEPEAGARVEQGSQVAAVLRAVPPAEDPSTAGEQPPTDQPPADPEPPDVDREPADAGPADDGPVDDDEPTADGPSVADEPVDDDAAAADVGVVVPVDEQGEGLRAVPFLAAAVVLSGAAGTLMRHSSRQRQRQRVRQRLRAMARKPTVLPPTVHEIGSGGSHALRLVARRDDGELITEEGSG